MDAESRTPVSIRVVWRLRDEFWNHRHLVLPVLISSAVLVALAQGIYTIRNGESGAKMRFGALVDGSVQPGLHFRLPLGIEEVVRKRTGEILRLQIVGDWDPRLSLVSGDENLITLATTVQYRILRLDDFLFASDDAEAIVHQTVRAELLEAAASLGVDDLLTSAKAGVQQRVQIHSQERLDAYGLGIALVSVNLQAVDPPLEAEEAFRAVLDSRAQAERGLSMARSRADRRLSLARGKAAKILSEAEAEADRRLQEARGAVQRFNDLLAQKRRSPDLTYTDLYARSVPEALSKTQLILLPPGETNPLDFHLVAPDS